MSVRASCQPGRAQFIIVRVNRIESGAGAHGLFSGIEHVAFDLPGTGPIGALLIHGFVGTPAELLPLGLALSENGISARGILLPGFGQEIGRLNETLPVDWMDAASHAWQEMQRSFQHNVLIGFSLGGAIALRLADEHPPDRLILLAPLWRLLGRAWPLGFLLPAAGKIVPRISPFSSAPFHHPHVRRFFERAARDVDVDDPVVRAAIRKYAQIDTATIQRLWRFALRSGKYARQVTVPTLVIQGLADQIVAPSDTRVLSSRLPTGTRLIEVACDHLIIDSDKPAWPFVRDAVVDFARSALIE